MNTLIVYDDTSPKSEVIKDVIGERGFSEVVVKRQTLGNKFKETVLRLYPEAEVVIMLSHYEFDKFVTDLDKKFSSDTRVIHFFSNFVAADEEVFILSLKKLPFIEENFRLQAKGSIAGVMSPDIDSYVNYLKQIIKNPAHSSVTAARSIEESIKVEGLVDIGKIENFIQCITGNFDARYFNSLQGDEYTIVKSSANKKKIKAEYTYYHLLPEDMRFWFVEPFHYAETDEKASYTMERLHMTDLAIKWVHGSIDEAELSMILDKYFYFLNHRHSQEISQDEYRKLADSLYADKVIERIEQFKGCPEFCSITKLLALNDGQTIDGLVTEYLLLKEQIESRTSQNYVSVIGHGDPCFANTMYNKSTRTLKFIDPKGALTENDLWTNPYYDIAKLSHSICGRYDFFNNGLFDINVNSKFETELHIDFDNTRYIGLFRQKLEENGYDYWLVRLYEASLFISMLPLHIDNPYKVYGFILNANNILKEIKENV